MTKHYDLPEIKLECIMGYPLPPGPFDHPPKGRLKTELTRGEIRYEAGTEVIIYAVDNIGNSPMFYWVEFPDGYRCRLFIDLDLVEIEDGPEGSAGV